MKTLQQWSLLFAGALASVIGGYVLTQYEEWLSQHSGLYYALIFVCVLLVLSVFPFQKIVNGVLLLRRKTSPHKIGILNDMGWDEKRPTEQFATGTNITIDNWKMQIEADAKRNGMKACVEAINANKNFYSFSAILNPYGGVYPEEDLAGTAILRKIFDYVSKGGIFVNTADVPGFWAYNSKLERKSVAVPAIHHVKEGSGGLSINSFTLVGFSPFVQKLGLNVNPWEKQEKVKWQDVVKHGTERFQEEIDTMRIDRIAGVERNVEPILTLLTGEKSQGDKLTPLFLETYDSGIFLISLIYQNSKDNPNNTKIKDILSIVLIQAIKRNVKILAGSRM